MSKRGRSLVYNNSISRRIEECTIRSFSIYIYLYIFNIKKLRD